MAWKSKASLPYARHHLTEAQSCIEGLYGIYIDSIPNTDINQKLLPPPPPQLLPPPPQLLLPPPPPQLLDPPPPPPEEE